MITKHQQSAGEAIARAKRDRGAPISTGPGYQRGGAGSDGHAAAPAQRSQLGHEHAGSGHVGPKAQSIGPENTSEAKSNDDALTGENGNGAGPPYDKGARTPTLAAGFVRVS